MTPIQGHLKWSWHIPESLENLIPIPTSRTPSWGSPNTLYNALFKYLPLPQEKVGTLRGWYCKRFKVLSESKLHINKTQSHSVFPNGVPKPLSGSSCPDSHGQHHCGLIHQQGGRYDVRIPLCPFVEAPVLVKLQEHHSSGVAHSSSSDCNYRQLSLYN